MNTMTTDRAVQNLARINNDLLRELSQLANEPAIARLVLHDEDGKEQVYFIARAGTLPSGKSGALMASYRSPIGRLAALRVGDDEDVRTPKGTRNYELRERATLHLKHQKDGWDSPNTVLHVAGYRPLTVVSLRQLLGEKAPEGADYLQTLIDAGNAAENVLEGIRRGVLTKMGLRDQPLLDQIQDNIFRMPLDTRLVVLGPPGTGKTTTLIKRLGQKLDRQHLDEDEQRVIGRTAAGADRHSQSWMMFTPTELLKQYVKEAFALEEIAASDERMKTWSDYRRELARNRLGMWRTDANNGPFVFRPGLTRSNLDAAAPDRLVRRFRKLAVGGFLEGACRSRGRLAESADQAVARLGKRLAGIVASDASLSDKFISIASLGEELQSLVNSLRTVTDDKVRGGLGQMFKQDLGVLNRLMQFVGTLEDGVDDLDDPDADEDEDTRKPADRSAAIEAVHSRGAGASAGGCDEPLAAKINAAWPPFGIPGRQGTAARRAKSRGCEPASANRRPPLSQPSSALRGRDAAPLPPLPP